nr:MAG TPA: hypothetical protein [Caudoviricetes sp.]
MYIIIGISLMLFFLIGFGVGLTIPFFVKKYIDICLVKNDEMISKEKTQQNEEVKLNNSQIQDLTEEVLAEWLTGNSNSNQ